MKITLEFDSVQEMQSALAGLLPTTEEKTITIAPKQMEEQVTEPEPAKEAAPEPVKEAEPSCSRDDISRTAVSMMDRGLDQSKLTDLLKKYGAASVPDLKTSDYDAFMAELKELEATL